MRRVSCACDDQRVSSPLAPDLPARRLYRRSDGRLLAGVAGGLADHLHLDVRLVRVVFVLLAFAGGSGIVMYALFWVFAPLRVEPSEDELGPGSASRDLAPLMALGALTLGALLLLSQAGFGLNPGAVLPLFAVGFGVVILWRQADDTQRERLRAAAGTRRHAGLARAAGGAILVVLGGGALLLGQVNRGGTGRTLIAVLVVVAGLGLVSGPWWLRMARDLSAERAARIREQERAELAAHVHDSVLHTLTLIQRHVGDPREVTRLARAQERELRGWLYRPRTETASTVQSALERAAGEVEDDHGVAIEVVVVGDCPVDPSLSAMVLAAREALVNAAKYAEGSPISVFGEVEPTQVTVFVRDRGPGFDPASVPADRLGLRQSVVGRMARHGGTATVRTGNGDGTEVQLEMPRATTRETRDRAPRDQANSDQATRDEPRDDMPSSAMPRSEP